MSENRLDNLNRLVVEFIIIVEVLKKKYSEQIIETTSKIYLDGELFEELLSQKQFIDVKEKKSIWRSLRWILVDKDGGRYTKKIYASGKTYRKIVIDLEVYSVLKEITASEK